MKGKKKRRKIRSREGGDKRNKREQEGEKEGEYNIKKRIRENTMEIKKKVACPPDIVP